MIPRDGKHAQGRPDFPELPDEPRHSGQPAVHQVARGDEQVGVFPLHRIEHAREPLLADDGAEMHVGELTDPNAFHVIRQTVRLDHDPFRPDVQGLVKAPGRRRRREDQRHEEGGLHPRGESGEVRAGGRPRQDDDAPVQIDRKQHHDEQKHERHPDITAPGGEPRGLLRPLPCQESGGKRGQSHDEQGERDGYACAGP